MTAWKRALRIDIWRAAGPTIALLALIIIAPAVGAEASTSPSTQREADETFQAGLAAAKSQNWDQAVDLFQKAYHIYVRRDQNSEWQSQYEAPILLNLGLAHANAGHDLAAICWFHAYIAAKPDAPNVAEVAKTIQQLKQQYQERIRLTLQAVFADRRQKLIDWRRYAKPNQGQSIELAEDRLWDVVSLQARYGFLDASFDAARGTLGAGQRCPTECLMQKIWTEHALGLVARGDIAGATADLRNVANLQDRDKVLVEEWSYFKRDLADHEAARSVIDQISDATTRLKLVNETSTNRPRTITQALLVQEWKDMAIEYSPGWSPFTPWRTPSNLSLLLQSVGQSDAARVDADGFYKIIKREQTQEMQIRKQQ